MQGFYHYNSAGYIKKCRYLRVSSGGVVEAVAFFLFFFFLLSEVLDGWSSLQFLFSGMM